MKQLRINEAFELSRARTIEFNENADPPLPMIKKLDMALILYPDVSHAQAQVMFSGLANGARSTIKLDAVPKIAECCGVDANFLFGMPSKHDEDFKRLNLIPNEDQSSNSNSKKRG